jgi:porphobilinogen synthase
MSKRTSNSSIEESKSTKPGSHQSTAQKEIQQKKILLEHQLSERPRRNRRSSMIRELVCENRLNVSNLILPLFVTEGKNLRVEIKSMPGQARLSLDYLLEKCREASDVGIQAVALFPVISDEKKNPLARESVNANGLCQTAIAEIKAKIPNLAVISDVAMDPYSSDGHDGFVQGEEILNDETLPILAAMAVSQAQAGVDIVAPSDMMDGRVGVIRRALDGAGYANVGILSYAAKYASSFYGPFREALDSAPRSGDKKTYQMDPANRREALREVRLDIAEGADMVMVKPALAYLDVISEIRRSCDIPVAAYQVSGEYAMIKAAAQNGWLDEPRVVAETLLAIKRAGADVILTYFALDVARRLATGK